MVNTTVKEVTNPVAGQDADHAGGTDWNQAIQVLKGSHATERIQSSSIQMAAPVTKTTTPVTLLASEDFVLLDATSNAIAVTLPTAVACLGGLFTLKRIDTTSNLVSVVGTSGQTIDSKAILYINARDESIVLQSDGANWRIISWRKNFVGDTFRVRGATLNRYYTTPLTANTASITSTVVAATAYAFPFIVTETTTFDKVQIQVVAIGAGSSAYAALYYDNGNGYPGILFQDFGAVVTSATTGVKDFTTGVPFTLLPGLYWYVLDVSATAPTVSGYAAAQILPILGTTSVLTAAHGLGWSVSLAAGVFPNPFTAGGAVIIAVPCPAVFFRAA